MVLRSRHVDLLRPLTRPSRFGARLDRLERMVEQLFQAGAPKPKANRDIVLGSKTEAVRIEGKLILAGDVVSEGTGGQQPFVPFDGPHQVLVSDGLGNHTTVTMPDFGLMVKASAVDISAIALPPHSIPGRSGGPLTYWTLSPNELLLYAGTGLLPFPMEPETVLMRGGGNITALGIGPSTMLGRESAGSLKALTGPQAGGIIGAFLRGASLADSVDVNAASYSIAATDFVVWHRRTSGGTTYTLPLNPGGTDETKILFICDADNLVGISNGITVQRNGSTDTINGGTSTWVYQQASVIVMCIFCKATRNWVVRKIWQ